ncbi:hypothetical protein L1049_013825 [Liquidambar formosana]|uniref:Uncharacterized protein n=1 Tax=Liquidambar formosana TaxID=63359 RepID=A0AAP0RMF0_LIQFO
MMIYRSGSLTIESDQVHEYSISTLIQLCSLRFHRKQRKSSIMTNPKRRGHSLRIIKLVLDNRKSSLNDNGATEPARVLLERLFAQTQKLEERINRDSHLPQDVLLGFNLEILESDLQAALAALKKKEEDLQDAERVVLLEHTELNRAKEALEQREEEIAAVCSRQEKLEEELKQANINFVSQARQIEDLKLRLRERDQEIAATQSALSLKEDELDKMRKELIKKCEEAAKIDSELKSKTQLLNETNEVVKKQGFELQELRKAVLEKEEELEVSMMRQKLDDEKLIVAEANLERQTMEFLLFTGRAEETGRGGI